MKCYPSGLPNKLWSVAGFVPAPPPRFEGVSAGPHGMARGPVRSRVNCWIYPRFTVGSPWTSHVFLWEFHWFPWESHVLSWESDGFPSQFRRFPREFRGSHGKSHNNIDHCPRYSPSWLFRRRFSIPNARRLPSNFAVSPSRTFCDGSTPRKKLCPWYNTSIPYIGQLIDSHFMI